MERSPVWCGNGYQVFFNGRFPDRIDFSMTAEEIAAAGDIREVLSCFAARDRWLSLELHKRK